MTRSGGDRGQLGQVTQWFLAGATLLMGLFFAGMGARQLVVYSREPEACLLGDCLARHRDWVRVVDARVDCAVAFTSISSHVASTYSPLTTPPNLPAVVLLVQGRVDACEARKGAPPQGELKEGSEWVRKSLRDEVGFTLPEGPFYVLHDQQPGDGKLMLGGGALFALLGAFLGYQQWRRSRGETPPLG